MLQRIWATPSKTYAVDARCMEEVGMRFMAGAAPRPVRVADVGAGHGFMSRYLTTFGAHVTAIERHKPAALAARSTFARITQELQRLGSSCTAEDVARLVNGDILGQYFGRLREQYDVIWCARVIHQHHPRDVPRLLTRLHTLLAEDGVLYLSAHAFAGQPRHNDDYTLLPSTSSMVKVYRENQRNGARFPGFVGTRTVQTKMIFKDRSCTVGDQTFPLQFAGTERIDIVPLTAELQEQLQPGSAYALDADGKFSTGADVRLSNFTISRTRVEAFQGAGAQHPLPESSPVPLDRSLERPCSPAHKSESQSMCRACASGRSSTGPSARCLACAARHTTPFDQDPSPRESASLLTRIATHATRCLFKLDHSRLQLLPDAQHAWRAWIRFS
jgi:SAM-dependent methyltransferase